jgi:hypothetical protein
VVVRVECGETAESGEATCVRMRILGLICCLRFFLKLYEFVLLFSL